MKSDMLVRIEIKHRVDQALDRLYPRAAGLGREMGELFLTGARSQMRGLEAVVGAATRTSALKNHVKRQTGKDRLRSARLQTWARSTGGEAVSSGFQSLGDKFLALLDDLPAQSAEIVRDLPSTLGEATSSGELARTVEIELQRGLVQTAVCAALYGR